MRHDRILQQASMLWQKVYVAALQNQQLVGHAALVADEAVAQWCKRFYPA